MTPPYSFILHTKWKAPRQKQRTFLLRSKREQNFRAVSVALCTNRQWRWGLIGKKLPLFGAMCHFLSLSPKHHYRFELKESLWSDPKIMLCFGTWKKMCPVFIPMPSHANAPNVESKRIDYSPFAVCIFFLLLFGGKAKWYKGSQTNSNQSDIVLLEKGSRLTTVYCTVYKLRYWER